MTPGANLSHSARLFGEAERICLAAILHLEAADLVVADIDKLLTAAGITEDDIAAALEMLGFIAAAFQRMVDEWARGATSKPSSASSKGCRHG